MRRAIKTAVELFSETFAPSGPVIEIGSYYPPGYEKLSDLRPYFKGRDYVGCDIRQGLGVDRIEDAQALNFTDEAVGAVLMFEILEHLPPVSGSCSGHVSTDTIAWTYQRVQRKRPRFLWSSARSRWFISNVFRLVNGWRLCQEVTPTLNKRFVEIQPDDSISIKLVARICTIRRLPTGTRYHRLTKQID